MTISFRWKSFDGIIVLVESFVWVDIKMLIWYFVLCSSRSENGTEVFGAVLAMTARPFSLHSVSTRTMRSNSRARSFRRRNSAGRSFKVESLRMRSFLTRLTRPRGPSRGISEAS